MASPNAGDSSEKADPLTGGNVIFTDRERQCWIKALSVVEVDFKGLLLVSDLSHFSQVLTQQETDDVCATSSSEEMYSAIIKCFRKKKLEQLREIPKCLRAAKNDFLAKELEDAYKEMLQQCISNTESPSVSSPVEEEEQNFGETRAFVGVGTPGGLPLHRSSLSSYTSAGEFPSLTIAQQSAHDEIEMKKKLESDELKMAELKANHDECFVDLRKHVSATERFNKHPTVFLGQLVKEDVSPPFDAKSVLEEAFPYITAVKTGSAAFDLLRSSRFYHSLNPELLVRIAEIVEFSEGAEKQKEKLHDFCNSLTVENYINMREYNQSSTIPGKGLSEIVIKLKRSWLHCTMEQVLQAVHKFCEVVKIPTFLCCLRLIQRACISISIVIPRSLVTDALKGRVQRATDELEINNFVEIKVNDEQLFGLNDEMIHSFMNELSPTYATPDQDSTAKIYQLLQLCQEHFDKMYEISHTAPEHFWRYLALRCLKTMGGRVTETASLHRPARIASCFNECVLNVSENCLDRHVQDGRGDTIALVYESVTGETEEVTYNGLLERTCRIANVLKRHGVHKGDCVVIYMPLFPQAVACMLACARIGAKHCNLPSSSSVYILKQRLMDAHAVALMTVDSARENSKRQKMFTTVVKVFSEQTFDHLKDVYISTGSEGYVSRNESVSNVNLHHIESEMTQMSDSCDLEPMNGNDTLFVMFTSGTTGGPKGLEHTQAGYLLYAIVTHQVVFHYEPGDVMAFFTDLGWIVSHTHTVYGALASGSTSFLYDGSLRDKDIAWLCALVERHKISQAMTTPSMLASLMNQSSETNLPRKPDVLKFLASAGECLSHAIRDWYREKLNCQIVDHYWQTETGGVIMANRVMRNKEGKIEVQESSLKPFFGVQPILINPKSKREERRCNTSGNLYLALPVPGFARTIAGDHDRFVRMYWEKADEHHNSFKTFDGAYRDKDGGYLIIGRVDDIIAIGEEHYDPSELESTLSKVHIVDQVAVVARTSMKGVTGLMFFVVLKELDRYKHSSMEDYLKQRLINVHEVLSQKPISFVFVKELPTTLSSKKSRHYLREIAAGQGIRKRTDLESLQNPSTPLDINVLYKLVCEEGESVLAHESADHSRVYKTSLEYPEVFWACLAKKLLIWRFGDFATISSCDFNTGHIEWFKEGILNATESCLDRHIEQKANPMALIHYQVNRAPVPITYKKLKKMTCQIANMMIRKAQLNYDTEKSKLSQPVGQRRNESVIKKVMICMPLTPLAVASMLACARIGAVHYNLPIDISDEDLWLKMDAVLPSAIVTVHNLKDKMKELLEYHPSKDSVTVFLAEVPKETTLPDLEFKMFDMEKEMKYHDDELEAVLLDSNHPLLATFSSLMPATTALYHSHAGFLLYSAASYKYVLGHQTGDRSAVTNNISSMMSLVYSVYGPLCNGGTAVLFDERFKSANSGWTWEMLSTAKVTQFLTTPDYIAELKQSNPSKFLLSQLRIIGTSGELLSKNDWIQLKEIVGNNKWTIIDHYGKPEIGGCLIASRPYLKQTQEDQALGSTMVPFFGVNLVILSSKMEVITEPGVEGDLYIKTAIPGMATHIPGDDGGTVMLTNYFSSCPGYYSTGDRATRDKDGNYQIKKLH